MRGFVKNIILILVICFSSVCVLADDKIGQPKISQTINQMISETNPNANIGVKIVNLDKNKIVFEKNAERYFVPASTLKFITIFSMIEYFGEDYKFSSKISNKGKNYYLNIHNPDFKTEDLDKLVSELAKYSDKNIEGNIYIIDKEFTVPSSMRTNIVSDALYCYGAPITMVHINKNCSKLAVEPGKIGGEIVVHPNKNFPYEIVNNSKTIDKKILDRLHVSLHNNEFIIGGTLSVSNHRLKIAAVANDNFIPVRLYLKAALKKHGVVLKGKILFGKRPTSTTEVAEISTSLKELSAIAMKKSDNFITDYLLAEFATKQKQNEWRRATESMKRLVGNKLGVSLNNSSINDGSGLSRLNLLTVNQFSNFLKAIYKKQDIELIKSIMACPGDDCTLDKRFKGLSGLYVKTGQLQNITNLVGYFYDANGELHSFVIMCNNYYGSRKPYHQLQEKIVRLFK